ncbi:hypothetical protein N7U66_08275 [Lacinutrix neustonica]|uniref:Uncharacterized protein n=1 Tax=Lacinutrix neustonica TaxID=2980107 RepID=A0A9E8MXF7_9FLAO|nr:hypothetical protein [Lacinutrix neustonica]WAC03472.1 hypothetical protein N7U66_08275 [Lacinutrix neustonica]
MGLGNGFIVFAMTPINWKLLSFSAGFGIPSSGMSNVNAFAALVLK